MYFINYSAPDPACMIFYIYRHIDVSWKVRHVCVETQSNDFLSNCDGLHVANCLIHSTTQHNIIKHNTIITCFDDYIVSRTNTSLSVWN